jgi:hypothetical protein
MDSNIYVISCVLLSSRYVDRMEFYEYSIHI